MATSRSSENVSRFINKLRSTQSDAPYMTQRDAINLIKQLNRTINICSSRNVQLCKNAIVNQVLPSPTRTAALFDYLVTYALASAPRPSDFRSAPADSDPNDVEGLAETDGQFNPPKSAFKRLHILYIVHDVLVTVNRVRASPDHDARLQNLDWDSIEEKLKRTTIRLTRIAACRGEYRGDEVSEQLSTLVARWEDLKVLSSEEVAILQQLITQIPDRTWDSVLEEAAIEDEKKLAEEKRLQEEATRWILPTTHGVKDDPDAPWYELPAANGLYMKSTRGYPLRAAAFPRGGFAIEHGGQVAPPDLRKEVTWLHRELQHCFEGATDPDEIQDIDALGNKIWKDPERPTRNYWGFTYDGISKVKENTKQFREKAAGYDDVAPSAQGFNPMEDVDAAVNRARMLAGGRGGFDSRGGRGRGGRVLAGGWRGLPRGGPGFRGGRGGPSPGRYS